MREIKFRAWDRHREDVQMITWEMMQQSRYAKPGHGWWNDCSYTLMQFTGFNDPAGAEIYERDIVYIAKAKEHREIRFSDGGFRIFASDGDSWPMNQERASGLMVVGNIYENPELLK
jgi:hypothetical protein